MKKNILFIILFFAICVSILYFASAVNYTSYNSDKYLNLNNLGLEKNNLSINYSFDNRDFIGDSVEISLWVVNESGSKVERIEDSFSINKQGLINRQVSLSLPKYLVGNCSLYIAVSSNLNNFIKQPFNVKELSKITGNAVNDFGKNVTIHYLVIFVLIIIILIFLFRNRIFGLFRKKFQ
jgi:hypothetical protein